jgi:hypothetical protein
MGLDGGNNTLMWSDILIAKEAEFTQRAVEALSGVIWAQPLLNRFHRAGGLKTENMPLMFEIRFAFELHRAGVAAVYEYPAGVGDSTVEFYVQTSSDWLIELVSIRASDALKRATRQIGPFFERRLSTDARDRAQSEEAEMITVEQKIGEKVFANGSPTKFPIPQGAIHLIVTDVRGYLGEGGDTYDYRQMAYGADSIPADQSRMIHYWEQTLGEREPIKGLFEKENPLKAARYIQERIHFLGFVRERDYREGEIREIGYYLPNPNLFSSNEEAQVLYKDYPLTK